MNFFPFRYHTDYAVLRSAKPVLFLTILKYNEILMKAINFQRGTNIGQAKNSFLLVKLNFTLN
jgi:hypothetical protein